jgi:peptidoglycan/LPS O-acetylase OafA/YrhL
MTQTPTRVTAVTTDGAGPALVAAASPRSWVGRWSLPGVGWVATISYSLYLSHKLVMHAVDQALPTSVNGGWRFVAHGVAILVGGAALHHLVERPGLKCRDLSSAAIARSARSAA